MRLDPATGLKRCAACKQHLTASEFNKDKGNKDKLTLLCRKCISEKEKRKRRRELLGRLNKYKKSDTPVGEACEEMIRLIRGGDAYVPTMKKLALERGFLWKDLQRELHGYAPPVKKEKKEVRWRYGEVANKEEE